MHEMKGCQLGDAATARRDFLRRGTRPMNRVYIRALSVLLDASDCAQTLVLLGLWAGMQAVLNVRDRFQQQRGAGHIPLQRQYAASASVG